MSKQMVKFMHEWDSIDDELKIVNLKSGDIVYATTYEVVKVVVNVKIKHLYVRFGKDVDGIWEETATVKLQNIKEVW